MIEHIVKNNESIKELLEVYHISLEELKEYNRHITDFNNLICGQKIKIPYLKDEVEQILDSTEVFVEKYYDDVVSFEDSTTTIKEKIKDNNELKNDNQNKMIDRNLDEINKKNENTCSKKCISQNLRPYNGILPPKMPYRGNTNK